MNFKKAACVILALVSTTVVAQDSKPPELTDKSRADILQIQLKLTQLQNEYAQLQNRINEMQTEFQKDTAQLNEARDAACKASKADCEKDWSLNLQTLKFEKKPTTPPPAPEKKKP